MNEQLIEDLKTLRNLNDIAMMLCTQGQDVDKGTPLATIIEFIFQQAQYITDEYCVVKE